MRVTSVTGSTANSAARCSSKAEAAVRMATIFPAWKRCSAQPFTGAVHAAPCAARSSEARRAAASRWSGGSRPASAIWAAAKSARG